MFYTPDSTRGRELLPGVFMKSQVHGANTHLCRFLLLKGAVIPAHQHPHEQTGYLVSGRVRFFGDEGETIAEPGAAWTFPGGMMHGAEALDEAVIIEVFSPLRQDYLP
jgi:quercetin dioxygenase-like cupin family protein